MCIEFLIQALQHKNAHVIFQLEWAFQKKFFVASNNFLSDGM